MLNNVNPRESTDRAEVDAPREAKPVANVKSSTLSDRAILNIQTLGLREIRSEIQIETIVNYDDLCGPWVYLRNPLLSEYGDAPCPNLCVWKYFTEEDVTYLKVHQDNGDAIRFLFENKLLPDRTGKDSNTVFVNVLWEFFKFARVNSFTVKSISACLGIAYLTHSFFLSSPRRTPRELHEFFYKTVLLHAVSFPPKSLEVFTVTECKLLLKLFHEIYIENLALLQLLCHPNYHFTLKLRNREILTK